MLAVLFGASYVLRTISIAETSSKKTASIYTMRVVFVWGLGQRPKVLAVCKTPVLLAFMPKVLRGYV
jgi:hypothetical protein